MSGIAIIGRGALLDLGRNHMTSERYTLAQFVEDLRRVVKQTADHRARSSIRIRKPRLHFSKDSIGSGFGGFER